jgi:hypothetical protein
MGFFDKLMRRTPAASSAIPDFHPVIDKIAEILGYDIRKSYDDYQNRVLPALNAAIESFDVSIAAIPGPIDLSASLHAESPLLQVLFPSADSISHALGRSMDVRQSVPQLLNAGCAEVYGLLGIRCRPEDQIAGTPPVFADHTTRSLSHDPALARISLREAALSRVVSAFGEHLEKLQKKGKLPRAEWAMNGQPAPAGFGQDDYVYAGQELLPEKMLQGLTDWLIEPSRHLNIQARGFRVSIKKADGAAPDEIVFPTMHTADRRHWLVCFVRFPMHECVAAMKQESKVHRYIFV